jgi:hypothetical protein
MTPIEPDKKLSVTLDATAWNNVLGALNDAPYRIAAPLIRAIVAQIEARQMPPACLDAEHIPARKANGADDHAAR